MRIITNIVGVLAVLYWIALLAFAYVILLVFYQLLKPFTEETE